MTEYIISTSSSSSPPPLPPPALKRESSREVVCEVQVNSSNDEPSRHESTLVAHKTLPACSAIVKLFIGLASEGVSVAMRAVKVVFISRYASLPPSDARSLRLLIRPRFGWEETGTEG